MIVDAHIHLYPPSVYNNVKDWATKRREFYWLACVEPETGPTLQSWSSVDQLLFDMDAAGVDQAVIQSWYWENHFACEESLDWIIEWTKSHPDRLSAFAPFNAKGGVKAIELLNRAFDAGMSGIGELNPPAQGYAYENEWLDRALELAAIAGKPVNFHVTDPNTRDYPGKIETPFPHLRSMAKKHPETNFVFAHLGGFFPISQPNPLPENVFFDTAAIPLLYDNSVYRKFCDIVGSDKIIFGSDYPLRIFPRIQKRASFQNHLDDLRSVELSKIELEQILGKNIINLLNPK